MIRFSVVIPAYNYGGLIERSVLSVCSQANDKTEIIVVDDGSTDSTPEVLARLSRDEPRLVVRRQENAGPSAARNFGVQQASGSYILFLDADDELLPGALTEFSCALDSEPDAEVVVASTLSEFSDGREKRSPAPEVSDIPEQRFLDYLYKRLRLSNGAVLMARSLLLRFPFNPVLRQTEDIPVFAHCLVAGRCAALDKPVVRIHKHDGSRRHGSEAALSVGMQLVEEVFDAERLPATLMVHRDRYRARRALSLFRSLYRARRFAEARYFFRVALLADWRQALSRPGNLLKYLRTVNKR